MKSLNRTQFDFFLAIFLTLFFIFIDRITKQFFYQALDHGESFIVIPDILHMTLVYNTGFAFGMFRDHGAAFIVVPIVALILLIFNIYYFRKSEEVLSRSYVVGFSLILAGAIGNLYDRIVFGYVIDFIDFRIWPVFNVADSVITIGAILVGWQCIRLSSNHTETSS